ncbi:MAG: AraC family transcriptional regulator [Synoicihabitans sp.]
MRAQIEHVSASDQESFLCRRFDQPKFDHPFHYHPEIEITLIERSRGSLIAGDHVGQFEPGEIFLLGENLPHIFRNTTVSPKGAASEVIHFRREIADGFIERVPEFAPVQRLLERAQLGLKFSRSQAQSAIVLMRRLRQEQGIRRWILFWDLLAVLSDGNPADSATLASPGFVQSIGLESSDRMRRACQIILQNFDQDLSHESLAAQLNLSPAYFSRAFKKTTRRTFTAFLTEVRLGHACRLLTETDEAIVNIAFHSGFRCLSNFNRRFLIAYQCTPRAYRQNHRQPAS